MKKIIIASALMLAATTSSFGAVKGGKIGVDFAYNGGISALALNGTAVGVWWHLTDTIALRPGVGFTSGTTTSTNTTTGVSTETKVSQFNFHVSLPIYLAKLNLVDLYVAPEFSYASTSTTVGATSVSGSGLGVAAALGLQVAINDQLHIFGELGGGYTSTEGTSGTTQTKVSGITTARTAVGAIFYFN